MKKDSHGFPLYLLGNALLRFWWPRNKRVFSVTEEHSTTSRVSPYSSFMLYGLAQSGLLYLLNTRHSRGSTLGPVHTNPFLNENGAVLLRFPRDLRPHFSFLYRFRRPHYNVSALKTLLYPQCACSNELDAWAFHYIGPRNWSHMVASVRHFKYSRSSGLAPGRVYFDDVTVFR